MQPESSLISKVLSLILVSFFIFYFYFLYNFIFILFFTSLSNIFYFLQSLYKSRGSSHDIREQSPDGTLRRQRFVVVL